jgi:hypothetical protein
MTPCEKAAQELAALSLCPRDGRDVLPEKGACVRGEERALGCFWRVTVECLHDVDGAT